MENKLDKLFRDQLSQYQETPSPEGWRQIESQLKSNRRALWGKRFAIAASILLIATIGFVGYRSLSIVEAEHDPFTAQSIDDNQKLKDQPKGQKDIELNKNEVLEQKDSGSSNIPASQLALTKTLDNNVKDETKIELKVPAEANEMSDPGTTESMYVEKDEEMALDFEDSRNIIEGIDPLESTVIASAESGENNDENVIIEKKKTYPKVTIVYKANQDSKLVVSGKQTILDKGINKITEFSDEHLLTTDRKTKLRNTKEDLLALNFGKLLNKSNKDLEN